MPYIRLIWKLGGIEFEPAESKTQAPRSVEPLLQPPGQEAPSIWTLQPPATEARSISHIGSASPQIWVMFRISGHSFEIWWMYDVLGDLSLKFGEWITLWATHLPMLTNVSNFGPHNFESRRMYDIFGDHSWKFGDGIALWANRMSSCEPSTLQEVVGLFTESWTCSDNKIA